MEIFVPGRSGSVIGNNALGGLTQNINFTLNAGDEQRLLELLPSIKAEIAASTIEGLRRRTSARQAVRGR